MAARLEGSPATGPIPVIIAMALQSRTLSQLMPAPGQPPCTITAPCTTARLYDHISVGVLATCWLVIQMQCGFQAASSYLRGGHVRDANLRDTFYHKAMSQAAPREKAQAGKAAGHISLVDPLLAS